MSYHNFEVEYLNLDKKKLDKPKDYFWLIIGILTPLAIGAYIFIIWYANLIINRPEPISIMNENTNIFSGKENYIVNNPSEADLKLLEIAKYFSKGEDR